MLQDETCFFLAVDFDKAGWHEDAKAFLEACRQLNLPAALERSRSGRGAHVWIFFEEAIPAALARRLGSHVLTETMEGRPDIGLDSYDRLLPNQDTMPQGGFGNLIALPLQKGPRKQDNSVFLDDHLVPWSDQWAFLASVGKIDRTQAEAIVQEAERRDRILGVRLPPQDDGEDEPWTAPPSRHRRDPPIAGELPQTLELVLGNQIYIAKEGLHPGLRNRLLRLAAFQNPEFYKAQAMRLSTYDKPRVIACAEDHPHHIGLPRGCLDEARQALADLHVRAVIRDERYTGRRLELSFQGELRPEQKTAADAMLAHETGVLAATTAFGKTVIAAWLVAQRGVNTLVLVHRRQLLDQWVERLSAFLGMPAKAIGRIGGGRTRPTGLLDVAVMQSLVRKGVVDDRVADYGHLIVDECHHLSAHSFEQVARRAKARFVAGLSATVARKDGHHPIIFMQCGPVRHRVNARAQAAARPFEHLVLVQPTTFQPCRSPDADKRVEFQALYQELVEDELRNRRICDDVVESIGNGRSPLVLTERNDHLDRLETGLVGTVRHLVVLRAGTGKKQRRAVAARLAAIPREEARVILATGKYVGEGFDDPRLDTLFLTLPVSWRGTVAQYAGRLHRLYDDKRDVRIYDYADLNVPMLARMFDRRCRGYEAVGYKILLPASAIPGWPADVVLPSDPVWKRDYSGSVRRLVRDGVDTPLASLFVCAARAVSPDAEGAGRARSATEGFLYRRLETLEETKGRFRVNVTLPIAFDGFGQLEVDLLCADARVAVELDGAQHLADPIAYRRDRRKDQALQENGYFVLRFLAEDVGKELDLVLDTILRSLSHRRAMSSTTQIIRISRRTPA
ncbi:MAG: restriction endonuclease subunit R [Acidobacteria bacterium RIFCSPLOWO2_12_FULL_65_11]|nr:MAG: restriction endonuclease subunit R [Acidobacteria bacterium RIFCSPLOWO2_02_FULL_64_15]OFW33068.1 MAG: restriction endonuclease subunit R [Acidobacteria bacterium RIFCSPLOWO2_12_FULL_65_11]